MMSTTSKMGKVLTDNDTSVKTLWNKIIESDEPERTFDFYLKFFMAKAYQKAEAEFKERIEKTNRVLLQSD